MQRGRALRILQITAPGDAGGLESVVMELCSGLAGLGHRSRIAALVDHPSDPGLFVQEARTRGLDVAVIAAGGRGYAKEFLSLRRMILEERPSLVHTHGYRADVLGGGAARSAGVPWVTTMHGFTGGGLKNRAYERMQVFAARWADAVVAVADPVRARLLGQGVKPDRVRLVPNAVTTRAALPRRVARERLGVPADGFLIGWVGRLSPEKAPGDFLEALALVASGTWRASILGDGPLRSSLEAHAQRLRLGGRLTWHGLVLNAAELFPAFDLWVLSSHTEGTPMTLLEAMSAGVPAVVTAVGGVPDVVGASEAWLAPPGRPDLLATAIQAAMQDRSAREARAAAAARRVRAVHDAAAWLDGYVSTYADVVLKEPRP